MSRSMRYPRTEASRRDRIAQHEIIHGAPRMHQARNDAIAGNPHGFAGLTATLTGTAIAGGVLESEIVTGGETIIITLTGGDIWHPLIGADNAITDALIAGITGDDEGGTGFNDEVTIVHGGVARTSDTVVTITLPASSGYDIAGDETVTVVVPAVALTKGQAPTVTPASFDITNEA